MLDGCLPIYTRYPFRVTWTTPARWRCTHRGLCFVSKSQFGGCPTFLVLLVGRRCKRLRMKQISTSSQTWSETFFGDDEHHAIAIVVIFMNQKKKQHRQGSLGFQYPQC